MLRIIGGKFRSRKLLQPSLTITRATKDRVREAIFSAISTNIMDAMVLDLFAGSGAYGLEALSRGAKFAYLNDHHPEVKRILEDNVSSLKIDQFKITQLDAIDFLEFARINHIQFDIVFIYPPYAFKDQQSVFKILFKSNLLRTGSIVVYENESNIHEFNEDKLKVKTYNYGRTFVHIGWKK
ncbi:MAG: hypothetical protein RLZZ264_458 [Bacillota bacterium]|jgi:16S rRNA (guanine966-N2)-methyltransferase